MPKHPGRGHNHKMGRQSKTQCLDRVKGDKRVNLAKVLGGVPERQGRLLVPEQDSRSSHNVLGLQARQERPHVLPGGHRHGGALLILLQTARQQMQNAYVLLTVTHACRACSNVHVRAIRNNTQRPRTPVKTEL